MKKSMLKKKTNLRRNEKTRAKIQKFSLFITTLLIAVFMIALPVYADGAGVIDLAEKTVELLFSLLRVVGVGVAGYSFFELATAIKGHDGAQRVQGIIGIVSGLIMVFVKEILAFIGVKF